MKKTKEQVDAQEHEVQEALRLKRTQDKIRKKYKHLEEVDAKYFQMEYCKAQAKEICEYLQYLRLTPFKGWYSKQLKIVSDPVFMYDYCLKKNEFEEIVPDYDRLELMVLPDPLEDDSPVIERNIID